MFRIKNRLSMISLEVFINFAVPGDGKNHGSSKTWKIPKKFFVSSYEMHFQGRQRLQCTFDKIYQQNFHWKF